MAVGTFPTPLAQELAGEGPMPFRDFMAESLYAPRHGFFTRRDFRGAGGPTNAAAFVGELAAAVAAAYSSFAAANEARLVEPGPGSGQLMRQVLARLPPELRARTRVEFIEPLLARRTRLLAILDEFGVTGSVVGSARNLDPGPGFVLAKELVSSFPVHLLERTPDGWREVNVTFDADAWRWKETLDAAPPAVLAFANEHAPQLPVGHRYEANVQLQRWLADVLAPLTRATLVVIDRPAPEPRPREGTVVALLDGREVSPYEAPGRAEVSAAADFELLTKLATRAGLRAMDAVSRDVGAGGVRVASFESAA